jgi:pyruvate dehydrogenase E2 component (dihydrolipoyllysine-residue acetyltransferase)
MPTQVLMPALSPTMTEGSLAKWHKKEGDTVKAGDILAEIETDKATMEFEAVDEGTLGKILVPEGTQHVAVNAPIAVILGAGEKASDIKSTPQAANPAPLPSAKPEPKPAPAPQAAKPPPPAAPVSQPRPAPAAPAPRADGHARIFASPLARRLARERNLDLGSVRGSGPHGRIVRADLEAAGLSGFAGTSSTLRFPKARIVAEAGNIPYTEVPHNAMRRTIARRMTESMANAPHFFLTVDCEIDALLRAREDINKMLELKTSVNDFIIRAAALALKQVPAVNASYTDDAILRWNTIDISVAVASEDGLITPIIKAADTKRIPEISA